MTYHKRLIEVLHLPTNRISAHTRRGKFVRHVQGQRTHQIWSVETLAASRGVICSALWPDSAGPDCPATFSEKARGWKVKSAEQDNRGFDLISRKLHPEDPNTAIEVRFIEVKGRSHTGDIAWTSNEYNTARRLRKDYWLYVVFHCGTPNPSLNILNDPLTLDWQPVVKVEHYRLRQDSVKHPVELKEDSPPYRAGGNP